ncbi:MAG: ferritin [Desulfuromonas sp.]|nr:MAG: ferritin [Desulfuromonas sp.]
MSDESAVCYTYEAALELAIEMENEGFRHYLDGIKKLKDKDAKELMREMALEELEHKHALEKALLGGYMGGGHALDKEVPTMNLDYVFHKEELSPEASMQDAVAYAIHQEKMALYFYKRMGKGCEGAPMGNLFERLANDESRHMQKLEDLYERMFMPEN